MRDRGGFGVRGGGWLVCVLGGCVLPSPSFDEPTATTKPGETLTSTGTTSPTSPTSLTVGSTMTTSTTGEPTMTGEPTTNESTTNESTTNESTTTEGSTTTGGIDTYPVRSCVELQLFLEESALPIVSGIYSIMHPITDAPIRVYCDLVTDGGGWILVARSAPSGEPGSFGWSSSRGTLENDDAPYSLGLDAHPFEFSDVLIGTRGAGKSWDMSVYWVIVPPNFVEQYAGESVEITYGAAITPGCEPAGGPSMLSFAGNTGKPNLFWFRDKAFSGTDFGLFHDRFNTYFDENTEPEKICSGGGLLSHTQGMIMVR